MYFVSNTLDDIVSRGKDVYRRTSILLRMETTPLLETINFTMGVRFILLDIYIFFLSSLELLPSLCSGMKEFPVERELVKKSIIDNETKETLNAFFSTD